MLEFDGVLGFVLVALWIHAIIDVVRTDESEVRHLPKQTWLFLVVTLPDVGALVWRAAGRPERPVARFAEYHDRPRRAIGPEDRPDFAEWAERTRRTEPEPDPSPTREKDDPPTP